MSRRPRLTLCLCLLTLLAACSLVKPVGNTAEQQAEAARLASAGKHDEAARAYAALAAAAPAAADNYQLLSAEQWVAAGNVPAAKQAYAAVSPAARNTLPTSRALVDAEIALADHDGARATRELDTIGVPTAADLAQNYWYLRGEAAFQSGDARAGTLAFMQREQFLNDTASLRASRAELFDQLRSAAEHNQLQPPAKLEPIVAGWLALGPVALELERNPLHAATAVDRWKRAYPGHPGTDSLSTAAATLMPAVGGFPDQVALLLPLSGRAESVGVAVRDGFIAAYLEQPAASRPQVKIYDTAAQSAAGAYHQAIQDGAAFVVGPLTKEEVAAVAPLAAGAPLLALNFLADSVDGGRNFYQFALLPEDEARLVARHLVAENKLAGVAILPTGEWGTRVGAAFSDELTHLGGSVLDSGRYEPGRPDFTDVIRQTLQVRGAKGEPATHRGDAAFVFMAGTPAAARLIVSQLKFHFAGDVPVYATSDSFEPDASANDDLDGLSFPDMPWMVSADPATSQIRDAVRGAWPIRTARRDRLYAFGFDAYRLVPALRNGGSSMHEVAGVTGRLRLDEHNRIRRDLDWAQIRDGAPVSAR